jgi:RNA polymerase sigma factor (TIGR02999 family)
MSGVTRILEAVEKGDRQAADELLPLVYDELRHLAAHHLSNEKPGQTLQPTALVHEAYLRLVGQDSVAFAGRGHFFVAAAEAMRRILIDQARRKARPKHGGGQKRLDWDQVLLGAEIPDQDEALALDEALTKLQTVDPTAFDLVRLRFFAGLSLPQASEALGLSQRTAERSWTYARAWLRGELDPETTDREARS